MKKGLFIIYDDLKNNTGVNRKIKSQIAAFQEYGIDIKPKLVEFKTNMIGYKIVYRLPFSNVSPVWKMDKEYSGIDFIYLRRPFFCNIWFLIFLSRVKKANPKMKIIYEIPTYPYDKEILKSKKNISIYLKDVICRKLLKRYIDRISILTNEKEVYGIPTIKIWNGYNFEGIKKRERGINTDTINIALVAQFDVWHGYERLIEGMSEYYQNGGTRNFVLHFAGDGPEKDYYTQLIQTREMQKHAVFYGMLSFDKLMQLYDMCDLGASSFGMYKIDIDYGCTLKTREYLAKGLPIISGCRIDINDIPELEQFVLNFENNSSNVDFNTVANFYDALYTKKSKQEVGKMIDYIHCVAQNKLNMIQSMKNVIAYIME